MPRGVRLYKSKRWCSECQTEIEVQVQHCEEEIELAPMGFEKVLTALRFVPPERAHTVEAGNLYVRCHSGGAKELVRKRERRCKCKDTMCKKCDHGHGAGGRPESVLAQKHAFLAEQRRFLQAQLARAEEREMLKRIGFREPRPYHFTKERDDSTPPPSSAAEMNPERPCRRRMSFASSESTPSPHHAGHCKKHHHHHHRRPSHHHARHEHNRYAYASPQPEYYVQEVEPPSAHRHHGRRASRIISNNIYHDDIPIFCQRIITGGRRKSSSGGCRRGSRRYSYYYPDVEFESREPEDYYY